ncbi:MAG: hypothetical protein ACLQBD_29405 [Syntrophobacteraceae bacterium]
MTSPFRLNECHPAGRFFGRRCWVIDINLTGAFLVTRVAYGRIKA